MSLISESIAQHLAVKTHQVDAAIKLLDDGATVPFIARYRKEATSHLTDIQLRELETKLIYMRELDERRQTIIEAIKKQDKLTPELEKAIQNASTKMSLEDIYLPYKPKRRTKASIAKDAGLGPLAESLLDNPTQSLEDAAKDYLNEEHGIESTEQAIEGARDILIEQFALHATMLHAVREYMWEHSQLTSTLIKGMKDKGKKFADFFEFEENIKSIPSHRAMALFRGRKEGILSLSLTLSDETPCYDLIASHHGLTFSKKGDDFISETIIRSFRTKLKPKLTLELTNRLREQAEDKAIDVFAANLKDLLLLPAAGQRITMGLDPAIRTGVKVVVLDKTGQLLDYTTVYPFAPQNLWHESIAELAKLLTKYHVELIAIGNGTGSKETDRLCQALLSQYKDLSIEKMIINEAGASVYSASELASEEFPSLDVSLRGAVSIGRRLQDPLSELVKIEPKSIGVGQYQHDVNPIKLQRRLEGVVEDCVNQVGVNINTASPTLLKYVAGFTNSLANNVVSYRNEHGPFQSREALKTIERLGEKTFEQSAGFLRIQDGENPLDNSSVHPERYELVKHIAETLKTDIKSLIGDTNTLRATNAEDFVTDSVGLPTIKDILKELEKPGRDPRPGFKTVQFKEDIESISDLTVGMELEGIVSNVAQFGAFVNIGVHQDGLLHISEMTSNFISDPRKIVKSGDIIKVRVLTLDLERKRINLTMKPVKNTASSPKPKRKVVAKKKPVPKKAQKKVVSKPLINTAMADALQKLKEK